MVVQNCPLRELESISLQKEVRKFLLYLVSGFLSISIFFLNKDISYSIHGTQAFSYSFINFLAFFAVKSTRAVSLVCQDSFLFFLLFRYFPPLITCQVYCNLQKIRKLQSLRQHAV